MSQLSLWPEASQPLTAAKQEELLDLLQPVFAGQLALLQLPLELNRDLGRFYLPLAAWLQQQRQQGTPLLVGLNGSQGSGKSSLCRLLKWVLEAAFDCPTLCFSIDDLYLTKADREQLARQVHPLLTTRGVPGTHDLELGLNLLERLSQADTSSSTLIPRFNKATDDRFPEQDWDRFSGRPQLILFEGWCVGASPQDPVELTTPVNSLERREDPEGVWRRYVNDQLAGPYRRLFSRLDLLLMLKIPDWELVYRWRRRQEEQLAARSSGSGLMSEVALRGFIQHYERLTRHQLATLPGQADLVIEIDAQQRVTGISLR